MEASYLRDLQVQRGCKGCAVMHRRPGSSRTRRFEKGRARKRQQRVEKKGSIKNMVRSMIAGVAGLKAHQSKMDVIGNNIANVNTWGFKGFSYNFMDSMYTNSIKSTGGNIEAGASGGRNASQVGYGSQLSSISNVFENGAPSPSANPMDCMIDGTGFFLVGNMVNGSFTNIADSGLNLSRVGIFRVDDNGYLVDDQRSYVYGYALVDETGIPETPASSASTKIEGVPYTINRTQSTDAAGNPVVDAAGKPVYTYEIVIAGVPITTTNVDADDFEKINGAAATTGMLTNPTKAIEDWVDKALTNTQFEGYTIEYNGMSRVEKTPAVPGTGGAADIPAVKDNYPTFTITSNSTGANTTAGVADKVALFKQGTLPSGYKETITKGVDYVAAVPAQYAEELSTLRIPVDPQTGQRYKLDNYSILEDGTVVGVDELNRTIAIGQVALIQVQNPNGLEKTVGYYYQIGANAGDVTDVKPGTGPAGVIKPSYLEMANVDLANEFSNIITTQRGFQANSKIITVTDEMLQELVNMKR